MKKSYIQRILFFSLLFALPLLEIGCAPSSLTVGYPTTILRFDRFGFDLFNPLSLLVNALVISILYILYIKYLKSSSRFKFSALVIFITTIVTAFFSVLQMIVDNALSYLILSYLHYPGWYSIVITRITHDWVDEPIPGQMAFTFNIILYGLIAYLLSYLYSLFKLTDPVLRKEKFKSFFRKSFYIFSAIFLILILYSLSA